MAWPIVAALAAGTVAELYNTYSQNKAMEEASEKELEARKEAAATLRAEGKLTEQEYNKVISDIDAYYKQRGSLGTKEDVSKYKSAIEGYNPEDYTYDFDKFNYDKTKEDFLNPYYSRIIGDTASQIQHSAAGAGLGRGTGAALNIAKGTAEKSDELYKTALQEYNQDRSQSYKEYADYITNMQNKLDTLRQGQQYKIGLEGNLAQDYYNVQDQAISDRMKAEQDKLNAKTAYSTAIARSLLIGDILWEYMIEIIYLILIC